MTVLLVSAAALAACQPVIDPPATATGYAYYQDQYKSRPGPAAPEIGYAYTPQQNDAALTQWQGVIDTLLSRAEAQRLLAPGPVFIESLPAANAFNGSVDFMLRDALRRRGYTLLTAAAPGVPVLRASAGRPQDARLPRDLNVYNGDEKVETRAWVHQKLSVFTVALDVAQTGSPAAGVRDNFILPPYGYVVGTGTNRDKLRAPSATKPAASAENAAPAPAAPGEQPVSLTSGSAATESVTQEVLAP